MATLDYLTRLVSNGKDFLTKAITTFTGNPNEIVGTNASGFIDASLLDPSSLPNTEDATVAVGVTLVAGDFVTFDGAGEVVLADNTAYATRAMGFVLAGFAAGATATVFKGGVNTAVAATPGTEYFLGVAGSETATNPAFVDGTISQVLGHGTPSGLQFEYNTPVEYVTAQP